MHPKSEVSAAVQSQLKRANAVQASLTKIAQDHPHSNVDVAGSLVAHVKADDAKVQLTTGTYLSDSSFSLILSRRCKAP